MGEEGDGWVKKAMDEWINQVLREEERRKMCKGKGYKKAWGPKKREDPESVWEVAVIA